MYGRPVTFDCLREAAHVSEAKGYVERQRQFVARLEELGQDAEEARDLLSVFETTYAFMRLIEGRILIELSQFQT
jgi:hypothetical protein